MDSPSSRPHPLLLAGIAATAAVAAVLATRRAPRGRKSFAGCTVVITGGSRGLGLALARLFAAEGATLALLARSDDQLRVAVEQLKHHGARDAFALRCDIRDERAAGAAIAEIARRTGGIDVLVNNAGIIQAMPFAHAQDDDFRDSLATHFWGPLHLIRAALPHMPPRGGGRIVNVASVGGRFAVPHLLPYVVGKFALVGLSEGLNGELRRAGISVTTVTPHLMQSGSHRNVVVRGQHEAEARWFALGTASRLMALDAGAVAHEIVEAARARRAAVSPGWQARMVEVAKVLAPELVATLSAVVGDWLLPNPSEDATGDQSRVSRDLDLGAVAGWLPTASARDLNQRIAADEAARHPLPSPV